MRHVVPELAEPPAPPALLVDLTRYLLFDALLDTSGRLLAVWSKSELLICLQFEPLLAERRSSLEVACEFETTALRHPVCGELRIPQNQQFATDT